MAVSPLPVTVAQLQHLLSHEAAFTKGYGFVVTAIASGSCTLEVPHLPQFERPGGIVSGQVFMTAADVAMWLAIKTLRGMDDPSVTGHMQTQFLRSDAEARRDHGVVQMQTDALRLDRQDAVVIEVSTAAIRLEVQVGLAAAVGIGLGNKGG